MTIKEIEMQCQKAVSNNEDLYLYQALEWLHDYNLIDWKTYRKIQIALDNANKNTREE